MSHEIIIECSYKDRIESTVVGDQGIIKVGQILIKVPIGMDVQIFKTDHNMVQAHGTDLH